jgi:hypothetical protein
MVPAASAVEIAMKTARYIVSATALALFGSTLALAQTPTPPPSTQPPTTERPPTTGPDPADASTPHQREATGNKTMQQCMDEQAAKNPSMSKSDMTKVCKEQMKARKDKKRY